MKWKIKSRLDENELVLVGWGIYFSVDGVSYRAFLYNHDVWSVIVVDNLDLDTWVKNYKFRTRLSIVQFIDEVICLMCDLELEEE